METLGPMVAMIVIAQVSDCKCWTAVQYPNEFILFADGFFACTRAGCIKILGEDPVVKQ